jgi:prophage maintenance system killer protein
VDGNKRTALVSTETFLKENGKEFLATDREIWELVRRASDGRLKFEEVVIWIRKSLK